MRTLVRNRQPFWYALYEGKEEVRDEHGFLTGENAVKYSDPMLYTKANISSASGYSNTMQFGILADYDKVIVTGDMTCPIDENSILWIDETDTSKPHDYIVKRVRRSINGLSYEVAKVKVRNGEDS